MRKKELGGYEIQASFFQSPWTKVDNGKETIIYVPFGQLSQECTPFPTSFHFPASLAVVSLGLDQMEFFWRVYWLVCVWWWRERGVGWSLECCDYLGGGVTLSTHTHTF